MNSHLTRLERLQKVLQQSSQLSTVRLLTLQQIIVHHRAKCLNLFGRSDSLGGRHWRLVFCHIIGREPAGLARFDSCSFPPKPKKFVDDKIDLCCEIPLTIRRHRDSSAQSNRPS